MKNKTSVDSTLDDDDRGDYVMCDDDDFAMEPDDGSGGDDEAKLVVTATPVSAAANGHEDTADVADGSTQTAEALETIEQENESALVAWNSRAYASGVLCCVLSSCCVGPVFGALLGVGAAHAAAKSPQGTAIGDAARAMGDVALTAKAKAAQVNEKHAIVARTKQAASEAAASTRQAAAQAWEGLQDAEKRNEMTQRSMAALRDTGRRVKQFDQDYRVTERTANGLADGFAYLSQKIQEGYGSGRRRSTNGDSNSHENEDDDETRNSDAAPLMQNDGTFA